MHENLKVMLKSSAKCRYILQIQTENDIANILSQLDCEYERFGEIYAVIRRRVKELGRAYGMAIFAKTDKD